MVPYRDLKLPRRTSRSITETSRLGATGLFRGAQSDFEETPSRAQSRSRKHPKISGLGAFSPPFKSKVCRCQIICLARVIFGAYGLYVK